MNKFFYNLILIFFIGLPLFFSNSVKASNGESFFRVAEDNSGYSASGVITEGVNQVLFCAVHGYYPIGVYGIPALSMSWGGDLMTAYEVADGGGGQMGYFYLVNPKTGAYNVSPTNDSRPNNISCVVFENVDQTSPVVALSGWLDDASPYNLVNDVSTIIAWNSLYNYQTNVFTTSNYTKISDGRSASYGAYSNFGGAYLENVSEAYTLIDYDLTSIYTRYMEVNTLPLAPTTHDYISPVLTDGNVDVEVCGSTEICEGDKLSNWQVIYDICDSWDYGSIFQIGMENESHTTVNEYLTDPYLFIGPRTPDQCRGSFQYREFFNENIGYENWHFFLKKIDGATTTYTYFEDFAFEVATLPEIIYSNGFILYTGSNPKIINTSLGAGTSTIPFQFNICADEEWQDSQFVLENLDTNELLTIATSTDVCAGTDILELPHANKFVNSLNARINLVNASSTSKILGNSFNIIWQLTDTPILETCKMPSYDINDICEDIDTSNMLGDIKCGLKYAIVVSAQFLFYPSCSSLTSISDTYSSFKNAFPFNTFFDFTDSIDEAIDTSLNSTTHTNNISLPFIRQTATGTEYYMLPVMSTTTISNTIGSSGYNTIRTSLAYLYWVLAGFIIFLLILKK